MFCNKAYLNCTIWFMISEKASQGASFFADVQCTKSLNKTYKTIVHHKSFNQFFSALKLLSCELVVFTDMNTYTLTEGRNSKHS